MTTEFDFVIVGAGSAGCVVAHRLAESGQGTVCVVEAGPSDRNLYVQIPAGYIKNIFNPRRTWVFKSEPVPGVGDKVMPLLVGKGLGGSSSINGMVYGRGQAADYDGWAQLGNRGWTFDDVLPYFRKSERRIGAGDDSIHGRSGPLTVSDPAIGGPLCDAFEEAAEQVGIPRIRDYNTGQVDGAGPYQFTIDTSGARPIRQSTARAFLKPAVATGRVTVLTESYAEAVTFEGRRATGIRYRVGSPTGELREIRARREVIVSAGTLNTPRLLQVSGIGPAELLGSIGVPVIQDSPGVGANLVDHFQLRLAARVKNCSTLNERGRGLALGREIVRWLVGRPSILGMGPVPMRAYYRSDPVQDTIDTQLSFTPASYREGLPGLLDHYPGMTCGGYRLHPRSRGWVRAKSADIAVPPEVQPNYLATEWDRQGVVDVVRKVRQIFAAEAFRPYFDAEMLPGKEVRSDDEILGFARQYGGTVYHHVGTARMGPENDRGAVVDDQLRVRGVHGLRVVDASIMPTTVSAPTNAATIMIGEKGADMILGHGSAAAAA